MAYTYQAPKDYDAQSSKTKKLYPTMAAMMATGHYQLQKKYDGVFSAIFTRRVEAESRQGDLQTSAKHLAQAMREKFGSNMLVFGELWTGGKTHKEINGMSRRGDVQEELGLRVFDIISEEEFREGRSKLTYIQRQDLIGSKLSYSNRGLIALAESLPWQQEDLKTDEQVLNLARAFQGHVDDAYDGLILRNSNAIWMPGASKDGAVVKIKPHSTLDLRIVEQLAEVKPTKLGGYIVVEYKGTHTKVGSGLTQEMLQGMMAYAINPADPQGLNLVGKVGEVDYLSVTAAGKLREPRLIAVRHDAQREEDK